MTLRERRIRMVECDRYYRSHSVLWQCHVVSRALRDLLKCIEEELPAWMRRLLEWARTGR